MKSIVLAVLVLVLLSLAPVSAADFPDGNLQGIIMWGAGAIATLH